MWLKRETINKISIIGKIDFFDVRVFVLFCLFFYKKAPDIN